jgi:hypothetical protein
MVMEENGERIGNNNTKAFALLLVANNFQASWLYEERKIKGSDILTEYEDTVPCASTKSVVDKLLVKWEIVLESQDKLMECPVQKDPAAQEFQDAPRKEKTGLTHSKLRTCALK